MSELLVADADTKYKFTFDKNVLFECTNESKYLAKLDKLSIEKYVKPEQGINKFLLKFTSAKNDVFSGKFVHYGDGVKLEGDTIFSVVTIPGHPYDKIEFNKQVRDDIRIVNIIAYTNDSTLIFLYQSFIEVCEYSLHIRAKQLLKSNTCPH